MSFFNRVIASADNTQKNDLQGRFNNPKFVDRIIQQFYNDLIEGTVDYFDNDRHENEKWRKLF